MHTGAAMAGAGGTTTPPPPPPLRLKDLLELDCDSCSAAGFRCYPRRLGESASAPMRHLLDSSPSLRLRRRPSKLSHYLSRSLSRHLSLSRRRGGGGFWRRRDDEEEDAAAATGTAAPAGCRSGSSSSEELDTSSSSSESSDNYSSGRTSRRRSRAESDSDFSSATEDSVHHPSQAAGTGDDHEVAMKKVVSKEGSSSRSEADDKEQEQEQLSPVAVMDFPFDDEDDEESGDAGVACSPPSFSLARLQRRKTHKIRRFEISRDDELVPLDLEARLATTSDPADPAAAADPPQQQMIQCRTEDAATAPPTYCAGSVVHDDVPDEDGLISLLKATVSAGLADASSERLLLDLFLEMKRRRSDSEARAEARPLTGPAAAGGVPRRKAAERVVDGGEAVAAAARGWLEGTGTKEGWGLADVLSGGAAVLEEMERGRRWMQVGEEEREVGAVVAGMLVDQLLCEVVRCLFV